ncbi:MAG: tetratricopeptide repeat protein, partial [Anaerolineales bacterium]
YAVTGKYAEAGQLLDAYDAVNPQDPAILSARAYVRLQQQDLQGAWSLLEQARDLDPQAPETLRDMSFVKFQLGDVEEALRWAEQSGVINPYDPAMLADRAFALRALGRIDEARQSAEQAVRLSPKSDLPHFILGVCYLDLGQVQLGADVLRDFINLAWDRAYVRDYVAQAQTFLSTLP